MDAQSEPKLKFLPRSFQRSQPAINSKSKRRVTVEDENPGDEESDRRSVFERLGPGGSQRHDKQAHYDYQDQSSSHSKAGKKRELDKSPDNLRLTFKGRHSGAKDQEGKVRSQVVVRKSGGGGSDEDTGEESDSWSIDKLDYKKELELEQKRKELQQALSALEANEDVVDKKSESSASGSSPERPQKKKKDKSNKKKEKKKHKKAAAEKEQTAEKPKEGKRRHESDDEEMEITHKKRKKKKQEKKQEQESPQPEHGQIPAETLGKHKSRNLHKLPRDTEMYDPESPTPTARTGSGDEKRSSSSSPKPKGGKGKKKKKKVKAEVEVQGKSKKLLSPLKKVLKVKKGPDSLTSSRRSRSGSHETRRHSRSQSSSSSESSSPIPAKRKKPFSTTSKEPARKVLKPQEKRKLRDQRSASSSPSESESSAEGRRASSDRRKGRKVAHVEDEKPSARSRKGQSPQSSGKDAQRRKRETSAESFSKNRGRQSGTDAKRGSRKESAERGRPRGRKDEPPQSRNSSDRRKISQNRGSTSLEQDRDTRGDRDAQRRDEKGEMGRAAERERGRDDKKPTRRAEVRKDETVPREREREAGRAADAGNNYRSRDRRGGSLEREIREERAHRGAGFSVSQQEKPGERGGRFGQRDAERDRFEESPGGRFPGNDGQRGGQFGPDRERQRQIFERGGGDFDQREGFDSQGERGRHTFQGPVRGQGRDRSWDERGRREGGDGFRDDWEGGRDGRGGVGFGEFRGDERRGREFGGGRDDRRGGVREDRLLPHLGGGDSGKVVGPDGHDSGRGQPRRPGYRDDGSSRQQDWKGREVSQDSRDKGGERDVSRNRHGTESTDGRVSRGSGGGKSDSAKDRMADRQSDRPDKQSERRERSSERLDRQSDRGSDRPDRDTSRAGKTVERSGLGNKQSSIMKVKSEAVKEDSPQIRDETSLATLFSQTESVAMKKKTAAKSFGGKKSPKSTEEGIKQGEKPRSNLSSRGASSRGRRGLDRRQAASRSSESGKGKATEKDKELSSIGQNEPPKDKISLTPSPRPDSQKGGESPKSQPQTRPPRRSSLSPDSSRKTNSRPSRSPFPPKHGESVVGSPAIKRSPGPSSSKGDRKEVSGRKSSPTPSTGSGKDKKRKEGEKPKQESETREQKKRASSRSRSGSESGTFPQAGAQLPEEKKRHKSSDSESLPAKLDGGDIAAAMLGDALDEEKVFSDWSDDDDADSILMGGESRKHQVEDLDHHSFEQLEPRHRSPGRYSGGDLRHKLDYEREGLADILVEKPPLEKNIPNVKIVEDIQKEKPARERRRRNTEDEGYEEISSDENDLDEDGERTTKRSIVSILDIDLAALMPSTTKTKTAYCSGATFERYKAASIFSELGVSQTFAGEKLFQEVIETCQKQLEDMEERRQDESTDASKEGDASLKTEVKAESEGSNALTSEDQPVVVKLEPSDSKSATDLGEIKSALNHMSSSKLVSRTARPFTSAPKPQFKLFSGVPAYHRMLKGKAQQRASLLKNSGFFYKALTARKDLDIRRQLCKIDPKYDQSAVYPSGALDPDLYQQCMQIFQQRRPPGLTQASQVLPQMS